MITFFLIESSDVDCNLFIWAIQAPLRFYCEQKSQRQLSIVDVKLLTLTCYLVRY
ncbi:uncharacterized protein DS421_8g224620 [Arachis hypogaea]|nr:uncharacterized protein DS421_8g224620 [Arachis hypogaea]